MPKTIYRDMADRIVGNSVLELPDECWIWIGHRTADGYGTLNVYDTALKRGITRMAHRVAYEVFHGPVPEGLEVDHVCHCPPCVNPNHLRLLPRAENARGNSRAHTVKWRASQRRMPLSE